MKAFHKRQGLYSSARQGYPQNFSHQRGYYDSRLEQDELYGCDNYDEEEEEEEEEKEEDGSIHDSDSDLQQKRAQLDSRLKTTFESIFAKYEQNFDGIGDEIDLETGEIIVNNGHLMDMRDERDAGGIEDDNTTEGTTETDPEEFSNSLDENGLMDEVEYDEEDDEEGEFSDEDMLEDDIILRGFAKATQHMKQNTALPQSHATSRPVKNVWGAPVQPTTQNSMIPTHSQLLAQFGPQLGPQIANLVSKQYVRVDDNIEPAWRVPDIPAAALPKRRPQLKTVMVQPVVDRIPSPEISVWASLRQRGPSKNKHNAGDHAPKRIRKEFSEEDGNSMLECVKKARLRGCELNSSFWRGLAAQFPRHGWQSWQRYYKRKYAYLEPGGAESEPSTSEGLNGFAENPQPQKLRPNFTETVPKNPIPATNHYHSMPTEGSRPKPSLSEVFQRPRRVRKPAQKDSTIISWSEAVNTIKSADPVLHAGILEDMRKNQGGKGSWVLDQPISAVEGQRRRVSDQLPIPNRDYQTRQTEFQGPARRRSDGTLGDIHRQSASQVFEESFVADSNGEVSISAACPHMDCKDFRMTTYALEKRPGEDRSQMSRHFLNFHQTEQFPCREVDCMYSGKNGFSLAIDLLNHIKIAHPNVDAILRPQGSAFWNPTARTADQKYSTSGQISFGVSRPATSLGEPGLISPQRSRVPSSSRPFSSSSDYEQTLTPRGMVEPIYTPMTSVSSMMVNRSSPKADEILRRSLEQRSFVTNLSARDGFYKEATSHLASASSFANSMSLGPQRIQYKPRATSANEDQAFLATASTLGNASIGSSRTNRMDEALDDPSSSLVVQNSSLKSGNLPPTSIPDSQGSMNGRPQELTQSSMRMHSASSQSEQDTIDKSTVSGLNATPILSISLLPPSQVRPQLPRSLIITPAKKRNSRKSMVTRAMDSNEADELSLNTSSFLILSSCPRIFKPPLETPAQIKREETTEILEIQSAAPLKKRKLQLYQGSDEIDELAEDSAFPSSLLGPSRKTQRQTKTEGQTGKVSSIVPERPMLKAVKLKYKKQKQRKGLCQPRSAIAEFSSGLRGLPTQNLRAATPLLDLTPAQVANKNGDTTMQGAPNSVGGSSSVVPPSQKPFWKASNTGANNNRSSSPMSTLLTPIRNTQAPGVETKEEEPTMGPAIVVKTPGGTLRKCGENRFACRKSFCFRCGTAPALPI